MRNYLNKYSEELHWRTASVDLWPQVHTHSTLMQTKGKKSEQQKVRKQNSFLGWAVPRQSDWAGNFEIAFEVPVKHLG